MYLHELKHKKKKQKTKKIKSKLIFYNFFVYVNNPIGCVFSSMFFIYKYSLNIIWYVYDWLCGHVQKKKKTKQSINSINQLNQNLKP